VVGFFFLSKCCCSGVGFRLLASVCLIEAPNFPVADSLGFLMPAI